MWIPGFKGLNGCPESEVPPYIHVKHRGNLTFDFNQRVTLGLFPCTPSVTDHCHPRIKLFTTLV